jgi:hypothetical protein
VSERLSNREAFPVNRHADQPVAGPPKILHSGVLKLSVAIWTDHQKVIGVMPDLWVEMVYFKVWLTVSFLESKRAKLTFPVMQLSEQDPNSGGHTLMALDRAQQHAWARLACRCLRHA